ncbi:MAG: hypothetical protein JXC36_09495 [Candidatus Atribacteria bacterium]|nr:hypothetical protein [Candidatus Atribacteria bacterium]
MKKNENCFIGMPSCGNVYESAKMVFVAAPADDLYKLKISYIQRVVESHGFECYLALRNFEPGSFAFCTKICSKIIQSKFCIVLLDPSLKDGINIPNPNVNLEYGMMIAQNKYIIPLQEEKYALPFNISPLDTIKYNDSNFEEKVVSAIDHAINKKNKTEIDDNDPLQIIQNYYAIEGYTLSDINGNAFLKSLFGFGQPYGYYLFDNSTEYIFLA